jgi:hypothetical protein
MTPISTVASLELALCQVVCRLGELDYTAAERELKAVARSHLQRCATEDESLSCSRLVAKYQVDIAVQKGCDIGIVKDCFHRACSLGFEDVSDEVTVYFHYAEACRQVGAHRDAIQTLQDLQQRVIVRSPQRRPAYISRYLRDIAAMIHRVEASIEVNPDDPAKGTTPLT